MKIIDNNMARQATIKPSFGRQMINFIIHLRWHYQVFILSGGFLMGGYFSAEIDWSSFLLQFANVHLLLFGGATAYNSYWDKDEGPVGGLKHPPPMQSWMCGASIIMQLLGLVIAWVAGLLFVIIYAISFMFFWFYSSPHFRWKATPVRSLLAIGVSTGTNSFLMGFLSASDLQPDFTICTASLGVAFIILSLYPVSQLYQLDEDRQRGYQTFAIKFGYVGVIRFFQLAFFSGILLLGVAIFSRDNFVAILFTLIGFLTGFWVNGQIKKLKSEADDYATIMRIKYITSLAFVLFIIILLIRELIM